MGAHDEYGKQLMSQLLGDRWSSWDSQRSIDEEGVRADLDGIVFAENRKAVECAVEIEARVYKQIRGALVDLALHPAPKKLLLVIKAQSQLGDDTRITKHCSYIWRQIAGNNRGLFAMSVLKGTGDNPAHKEDCQIITESLKTLALLE